MYRRKLLRHYGFAEHGFGNGRSGEVTQASPLLPDRIAVSLEFELYLCNSLSFSRSVSIVHLCIDNKWNRQQYLTSCMSLGAMFERKAKPQHGKTSTEHVDEKMVNIDIEKLIKRGDICTIEDESSNRQYITH